MELDVSSRLKLKIEISNNLPARYQRYYLPGASIKFCKGPFGAFIQQRMSTLKYSLSYQVFFAKKKFQMEAVIDKATVALNCTISGPIMCLGPLGNITHNTGKFDLHYIPQKSRTKVYLEKGFYETIVFEIDPSLLAMFVTEYPWVKEIYEKLLNNDLKPTSFDSSNMGIPAKNQIDMIFEKNDNGRNVFIFNRINEIYLQYFIKINGNRKDHAKLGAIDMDEIADYIKNNYNQIITITELSRLYGIHISTLERDFKKRFGTTIKQFLTEHRMRAAIIYLLNSNLPINEIAMNIGYSDVAYFSKQFKNYFKQNPSSYRKSSKTNTGNGLRL